MALLTATLFDGINALNPLLIVRSILVTFPSYAVLLLQLGLLAGILLGIYWTLGRIPLPRVLSMVVYLYLLLIGAHLLGRFYWRGREKLGWGL